jgi:hypothetical protein
VAVYLFGLVAFRYRHVRTVSRRRLGLAIVLLFLVPVGTEMPALASVALVNVLIWTMLALDTRSYGEGRQQVRRPDPAQA